MMSTIIFRRLRVVGSSLHFRNVFSTESHSQALFSQFASTKLNLSEAQITRMFQCRPHLRNLQTLENVEKIIHLLKKYSCTEFEVSNVIRRHAQLIEIAETILETKLKVMEGFGFAGRDLAKLVTKNSSFLCSNLENNVIPKLEFLKNLFGSEDLLVKALLRAPRLLSCSLEEKLKPSLAFWKRWGFSGAELVSLLQVFPPVLMRTALIPAQLDLIDKIGGDKNSKMYKYIVALVAVRRVETLEKKIENLKKFGLSAEETWQLIGAFPLIFSFSTKNVSEKMDFLVNNMELPAHYVVKHPSFFQLSLEKTTRPRFLVWQKIKSIDASGPPLFTVLRMTETKFVNKIIKEHPKSEMLWAIYENAISNASHRTMSSTKQKFYMGKLESGLKHYKKHYCLVFGGRQGSKPSPVPVIVMRNWQFELLMAPKPCHKA